MFERIHLSINEPSLISIIVEQCVGVLSLSARIRASNCEFIDKTPQIAEEQLVMTMDKPKTQSFKDTKVSVAVFFLLILAKAKNFQDSDQLIRLYTMINFLCN